MHTSKVVNRLNDVVNTYCITLNTNGICFKNKARLLVRQAATLNVVRIICKVNLRTMIYSTLQPRSPLLFQHNKQRHLLALCSSTLWQLRITRHTPCLANKHRLRYLTIGTIIAHSALRNTIPFGKFSNRNIIHTIGKFIH